MTIHWLESVDSTQSYLKEALKSGKHKAPLAIATLKQTNGSGSRGNKWIGLDGNLFFSFAIAKSSLPDDLKLESASIYFMFLLKEVFKQEGSKIWLKWPNDFYLEDKKIGGCITNIQDDALICGIGINLKDAPDNFGVIDINIEPHNILQMYLKSIEKRILWKQIFSKYKLEFENNISRLSLMNSKEFSFLEAKMMDDGSLMCNGKRIYSQR